MANTRTVGAAGDHTTVGAALAWFQTAAANHQFGAGGDGIGTIEIIDAAGFAEEINIDDLNYNGGAPTSSSHLVLTSDTDSRHAGLWSDSKAHMDSSASSQNAIILITEDYTVIQYLQISQDSSTNSDEAIRVQAGVTGALFSRCILRYGGAAANSTDGIYTGNWTTDFSADNCIIYGFQRGGIHLQNFSGSGTVTGNADHCTVFNCGSDGSTSSGGFVAQAASGTTTNFNLYNCAGIDNTTSSADDFQETLAIGTLTWGGTHNCSSDTSLTTIGLTTGAQESLTSSDTTQSSGTFFVVKELDSPNFDFQLLDTAAGNIPVDNGTNRQGSEPDSRQDFSTDVAGNTRGTVKVDIGASQVSVDVVSGRIMSSLAGAGGLAGMGGIAGHGGGLAG